ncbi:MAG: DNA alkylation repair protein [Actinomycetota bacterium]
MAEAPKLKDYFTPQVITEIGERFAATAPGFDVDRFCQAVLSNGWDDLTFTARTGRVGDVLWDQLGRDPLIALQHIEAVLPDELGDPEGALTEGFWMWPLGDLIAAHTVDHPDAALTTIEALTRRFTGEFAVRPFLARYPETLDRVEAWATSDNEHVRRLASEGTRPRLPWATRLTLPLERILPILATLRRDRSRYVQRSVANHLNDLAKDNGERIVSLLEEWHAEDVPETTWIVRHAMRNHLKDGDPRVLALFGYQPADAAVGDLTVTPETVAVGQTVTIDFTLTTGATAPQRIMVDLVVGYRKANGSVGPKVFKFRDFELAAAATEPCTRSLAMVERSTRKLHPGHHTVAVRVNGADLAETTFELTT